jgi:hypothetical protein
MIIRLLFTVSIIFLIAGCVEEFQPELDEFDNILVVDGSITNLEGPYTVKLSISSGLDIISPEPVSGALVTIFENNGPSETLKETEPGTYQTKAGGLKGIAGKEYRLQVILGDKKYTSEYEVLKEPTPISSVEARLEYKSFPDAPEVVPGFQFYVNSGTSPYPNDYYLWTLQGTYKYEADLLIYYIYEGFLKEFEDHDALKTCYRTYDINEVYTTNTYNLQVPRVESKPLHYLPANDKKLVIRYSLLTRQYSVSREAYNFWHAIELQTSNNSSLYTTQPYQIRGNLKNESEPDEPVLGYFMVAGVTENRIFVELPEDVEIYIPDCWLDYEGVRYIFYEGPESWPIYLTIGDEGVALSGAGCMDCREVGGVLEKPPFWED